MRHRHLDLPADHWSPAVVDSILERGSAADVWALLRALLDDPHGRPAAAAWEAASQSTVYGYPALIRACLEKWRHEPV